MKASAGGLFELIERALLCCFITSQHNFIDDSANIGPETVQTPVLGLLEVISEWSISRVESKTMDLKVFSSL